MFKEILDIVFIAAIVKVQVMENVLMPRESLLIKQVSVATPTVI
jgi:hypothetical protein